MSKVATPGDLVIQYMDDSHRFVGVVVDPTTDNRGRLALHDQEHLDHYAEKGGLHICLVLGIWEDYTQSPARNVFHYNSLKTFPWYRVSNINTAEVIEIGQIVAYHDYIKNRPRFQGLNYGSLFSQVFGPTPKQIEVLQMCKYVNHYTSGGSFKSEGMPEGPSDSQTERLYAELAKAIPR